MIASSVQVLLLAVCGFLIQQRDAYVISSRGTSRRRSFSASSFATRQQRSCSSQLHVGYVPNPADSTASIGAFLEERLDALDFPEEAEAEDPSSLQIITYQDGETNNDDEVPSSTATAITSIIPQLSDLWTARLLLVGAAALYGTNFSLVKILGDEMPVGVSSTLRFGLASLATMPWLLKNLNKQTVGAALMGIEVGMWNSIGYVAQAVGLETTAASESAFICSLAVVTVPLLEFITGKKLLPRQWIGAILAVVGVAMLELGGSTQHVVSTGDLCSLVQPLAFGMGFFRMERAMKAFPQEAARSTAGQLFAVFLASAAYGFWSLDTATLAAYPWHDWLTNPSLLFSLFWTGVITTALTIYMETKALKTLSAAETTLIFSTEPLWGTAFASVVMGEQLGMNAAMGGLLILSGCVFSNLGLEGIQKLLSGKTEESVAEERQKKRMDLKELPKQLEQQWLWLTSSMAASFATWSLAVEEEVPRLNELKEVVLELVEDLGDKLD